MYLIASNVGGGRRDRPERPARGGGLRGRAPVRGAVRAAAALDRRGRARDLRRQGVVGASCSTRRPTSSCSRPSPARASSSSSARRIPSSTGIAGWVLSSRTPLVLEDVQSDPRFAREVAAKTGFVPKGLMAVPLLDEERVLGVLQVLDRPQRERFSLQEMELLGLFANQAAIALSLLRTARQARASLAGDGTSRSSPASRARSTVSKGRSAKPAGAAGRARARARRLETQRFRTPSSRAREPGLAGPAGLTFVLGGLPCGTLNVQPRRRRRCRRRSRLRAPVSLNRVRLEVRVDLFVVSSSILVSSDISNPPCAGSRVRG